MTAQLAKVMERLLQPLFVPVLMSEISIGANQFAYCRERGARDAIAYLMLSWFMCFLQKRKIGLYMADVSAAFDRVSVDRLIAKLIARNVPEDLLKVFVSWLRARWAEVVVNGAKSAKMKLQDMVFQGTVWGPMFWNVFYQDADKAIRSNGFLEIVFADDLNAFKEYDSTKSTGDILADIDTCQTSLHRWGRANQVTFDAAKESRHILSRKSPHGEPFKLLGIWFDCKLVMTDTVFALAKDCRWKLTAILRTARYNTCMQLVLLYKAQLLSFIEYRTPAIYHACASSLEKLEHIQDRLLEAAGMSSLDALVHCRLAPLSARRDIAMLGLIHRTVLGKGPSHFRTFFKADAQARVAATARHRLQLIEYKDGHWTDFALPNSRPADYISYSMLGLVSVYNRLPAEIVEATSSVSAFQGTLQAFMVDIATAGHEDWAQTFSPRVPWHRHPLS